MADQPPQAVGLKAPVGAFRFKSDLRNNVTIAQAEQSYNRGCTIARLGWLRTGRSLSARLLSPEAALMMELPKRHATSLEGQLAGPTSR